MPTSRDPAKARIQRSNLRNAPAAPAGHRRGVVHGAYSRLPADRVDAKVREVADALAQDAPVRADDGGLPAADSVVVRQLAETLCRLDDIAAYLHRRGWEDESGKPRPVLEYEGRLRSHVLSLLIELGMTPASRAKLGVDLTRVASAQDHLDDHLRSTYGDVVDGQAVDGEEPAS